MSGAGMILHEGTYFTPEDLRAKQDREAAALARSEADAKKAAGLVGKLGVELNISDETLQAVVAPLVERFDAQDKLIEALSERVAALESSEGSDTPDEDDSAADEAAGPDSGDVPDEKPAAKAKKGAKA